MLGYLPTCRHRHSSIAWLSILTLQVRRRRFRNPAARRVTRCRPIRCRPCHILGTVHRLAHGATLSYSQAGSGSLVPSRRQQSGVMESQIRSLPKEKRRVSEHAQQLLKRCLINWLENFPVNETEDSRHLSCLDLQLFLVFNTIPALYLSVCYPRSRVWIHPTYSYPTGRPKAQYLKTMCLGSSYQPWLTTI